MSGISSDVFAEPMLEDDDFLEGYVQKLKDLLHQGSVPDLKKEMIYKVYSLQGSKFGSHKSIVLTADDQRFFTIELGFITVDGVKRIYPVTRKLSPDVKGKLYHGQLKTTSGDLISKGIATMKNFGKYFKYCNNCQNYCNYYLDVIGLGQQKTLTDRDKLTALAGAAAVILAVILKLLHGALNS